jgi:large subunit ribosomal protein L22
MPRNPKTEERGIEASHRYARVSPQKCRLVADLVRGRNYHEAQSILHFTTNKSARLIAKVLQSAYHNAMNNFHLRGERLEDLYISEIWIDEAGGLGIQGKLKRIQPRAQGRANRIIKRSSHIHVVLAQRD